MVRATVPERCDNCGTKAAVLNAGEFVNGRVQWLCDGCVHRIARSRAMVERAGRRRAA